MAKRKPVDSEDPKVSFHTRSLRNRDELSRSGRCGCFYCLAIFDPHEIKSWTDKDASGVGLTALCAKCGIDSVIGDAEIGAMLTKELLTAMRDHWF